ncbi:glycosyltransferase family 4 protein [Methylophilaceae bacterium]|nr:glycosyltransferase family 4 protein [Methylophilaceae bacterium]
MNKFPILHIIKRFEKNHGPSNIINNIVRFKSDKRHIIYSLYPPKNKKKYYHSERNIEVYYGKLNFPAGYFLSLVTLIYLCFKSKPKIIEGHLIHGMAFALLLKLLFKVKLIVVHHNVEDYFYGKSPFFVFARKVQIIIHRFSDLVICVSKGVAMALNKYGLIHDKAEIEIIYNGVDSTKYRIDEALRVLTRKRLGIENDTVVIMMAGWLIKRKNTDLMIESMSKILSNTKRKVELIIFGEGPHEEYLNRLIDRYSMSTTVRMFGFSNDLVPYYNAADIFCLPSFQEGFGLVLVEAMLCGTCCVGSNVAGVSEIIIDDVNGKLFDVYGDEDALCAIMINLINNPIKIKLLRDNCRGLVDKRFSTTLQASLYNDSYGSVIS